MRAHNVTRDKPLATQVEVATSFGGRLLGLMGRKGLPMGTALHIEPCNSIHTFFMRFPIDALFLDRELRVTHLVSALPPWRATRLVLNARSVLELPAGVIEASGTRPGDTLRFETPLVTVPSAS